MSRLLTTALAFAYAVSTGGFSAWAVFATQVYGAEQDRRARRDRRRALQAYNDSLQDRLEMVERDPNQARSMPLGRVRCVEGVRRDWQSGTHSEKLTLVVSFAGCQIDAFESFYLDDLAVTLNGSGYVQEAPYLKGRRELAEYGGSLDGSGGAVVVIAHTPAAGTLAAYNIVGSGAGEVTATISVSLVGLTATISGGTPGERYSLTYEYETGDSLVRIRSYLGTSAQNIGSALSAEYGGAITATDKFAGIAAAVMDLTYDTDVFPTGRPTLTAVVRGALCYDPRLDGTVPGGSGAHRVDDPATWAWSENPAILALRYALWEHGFACPVADIRLADFMAAADACDVSTVFTMRKADGSTTTATLPRFRCGIVVTGEDPRAEMDAIVETMAGRWAWSGGQLRIRAGEMAAPAFTVDSSWFMLPANGGEVSAEPVIRGANSIPRHQRINRVAGNCVDPAERWQALPFPAVSDSVLIAAKGLRAEEVTYEGVTHIAHAQHVASIAIREAQAGLRLDCQLGLQALGVEVLDVGEVDLARYGFEGKTAEVVGWQWAGGSTVSLQLAEITDAMFTPDAELGGRDPAPDSNLRAPWDVEQVTGLTVTSGVTATLDGAVMTRAVVEWDAAAGESVRQGGEIEVQYAKLGADFPDGDWPSWVEAGTSTKAVIPGLLSNRAYAFRARAVQRLPLVRGKWSEAVRHIIAAPPLVTTGGLQTGAATDVLVVQEAGPNGTGVLSAAASVTAVADAKIIVTLTATLAVANSTGATKRVHGFLYIVDSTGATVYGKALVREYLDDGTNILRLMLAFYVNESPTAGVTYAYKAMWSETTLTELSGDVSDIVLRVEHIKR